MIFGKLEQRTELIFFFSSEQFFFAAATLSGFQSSSADWMQTALRESTDVHLKQTGVEKSAL